jgi:uncharacterized protein GlcG (DUF336 family)
MSKKNIKMNLDLAQKLIAAAKKKAEEIGVAMVISVVDEGGNLVATQRMDNGLLVSINLSINKAYTCVAVKIPTHVLGSVSQSGQPLFGIHSADNGRIVIFGGGLPLIHNDAIIGAIGVSGGSVEQDIQCATAGADSLK